MSGAGREGPLCVSVINLKGGVGKTTIAALLGRNAVVRLGLDVLAIDLDPQANLSQAFTPLFASAEVERGANWTSSRPGSTSRIT